MKSITEFTLTPEQAGHYGSGLHRPECIIAERDGTLWVSDSQAALTRIDPDGAQSSLGKAPGLANGFAMTRNGDRNGSFYIADIEAGLVLRLTPDGDQSVFLEEVDGQRIVNANFVYVDHLDRLWITAMTRAVPRSRAREEMIADGFVVLVDDKGPRIVADGLYFTNEVRIDASGTHLYIVETTKGRVVRHRLTADGVAPDREVFGPDGLWDGALVDGITFDADGNLWLTEITRNTVAAITPDGSYHAIFSDEDGATMDVPTSITFAGEDLKTVYVGSLTKESLVTFRSPVAGAPMRHW